MKRIFANIFILSGILGCLYTIAADPFLCFGVGVQYAVNFAVILIFLPVLIVALIKVNPGLTRFFN